MVLALGIPVCFSFTIYLLLCTSYRWLTLLYVLWAWVIDKNRCERGGRRSEWVRSWIWWKYFCDYFPARLEKVPDAEFSKDKNYLFCSFPHGVIPIGPFCAFISNHLGYREHFPHHTPYPLTLTINFFTPFFRELAFAFGSASVSAKSITHILSKPDGGNIAIVSVGGASEAYNCKPGQYKLILKKRKGFVKLALQIGSPIVPVMSFGETDTFDQVDSPEGSKLRKFQEFVRKLTGIAPIIAKGRGPLGMMPRRKPVTILGKKEVFLSIHFFFCLRFFLNLDT